MFRQYTLTHAGQGQMGDGDSGDLSLAVFHQLSNFFSSKLCTPVSRLACLTPRLNDDFLEQSLSVA